MEKIVEIKEPKKVTLNSNPNFFEITGIKKENEEEDPNTGEEALLKKVHFEIIGGGIEFDYDEEKQQTILLNYTTIQVKETKTGIIHSFKGMLHKRILEIFEEVNIYDHNVYEGFVTYELISEDNNKNEISDITLRLKNCMAEYSFFKEKFDLTIDEKNPCIIEITAKGIGPEYDFEIVVDPSFINILHDSGQYGSKYNFIDFMLTVNSNGFSTDFSTIMFVRKNIPEDIFRGTKTISEVNSTTFFVHEDSAITAENFRMCLMQNPFFKNNYNISIAPVTGNGNSIRITAKEKGEAYCFKSINASALFISVTGNQSFSLSQDMLLRDSETCEIQLDLYKNSEIFLGSTDNTNPGEYVTTLSKSYYGKPLWFDVNTLWTNDNKYSNDFLKVSHNWCDTGTAHGFRFVAKRNDGINTETLYHSDMLYAITGYTRNLQINDLQEYVYNINTDRTVKPLTNQPELTHIRDQKQYFNFILSDPDRQSKTIDYDLGILYKAYTQSGRYLGSVVMHNQSVKEFNIANTILLDMNPVLDQFPQTGIIKACLHRDGKEVSLPQTYRILPSCLYKIKDFAFLNALGGWSSFSFGGSEQTEFKTDSTRFYRSQTPDFDISSQIEAIFNKEIEEQFTVQTYPITSGTANWLKELSASTAVYELSTKRYIIVDDMSIKYGSKDDLFTLQMKYHYSDSYNTRFK